jgi:hypothetical protein
MDDPRRARKSLRLAIFAIVALGAAYFAQGGGMNPNSRYDLTRAIVVHRAFAIDAYQNNTIDKAFRGDHFYSDKAPGLSFAAVPVFAVERAFVKSKVSVAPATLELHALTFLVVGLASAGAAVLLLWLLESLGFSASASSVTALAWTLGTNAFGYATLFMAHQFVASLLVASFALARMARPAPDGSPASPRRSLALLAASGLTAAWAAISEFPAAPIGILAFAHALHAVGVRRVWAFVAGTLAPFALLATFNTRCFGSPFALGYSNLADERFRKVIEGGVMGFSTPKLDVIVKLLIDEGRGLLPLSPFLLLAIPGFVAMVRDRALRPIALVSAGVCTYGILLFSSYPLWHGGAAMGPRYLVPMLPFAMPMVAAGLAWIGRLQPRARGVGGAVAGALVGASIVICTMTVAVMPELPDVRFPAPPFADLGRIDMQRSLRDFVIPMFVRGRLSEKGVDRDGSIGFSSLAPGHERDALNLGELAGLHGLASLLPLGLAWAALGAVAWRAARRCDGAQLPR